MKVEKHIMMLLKISKEEAELDRMRNDENATMDDIEDQEARVADAKKHLMRQKKI